MLFSPAKETKRLIWSDAVGYGCIFVSYLSLFREIIEEIGMKAQEIKEGNPRQSYIARKSVSMVYYFQKNNT